VPLQGGVEALDEELMKEESEDEDALKDEDMMIA